MCQMREAVPFQVGEFFRRIPTVRTERWSLLTRFFAGWLGPIGSMDGCTGQSLDAAEQRLKIVLPRSLREWYELAGLRKEVWSCQDHLLMPEELRIEEDRLIICVENQAVVKWAIPLAVILDEDPPVFVSDQLDRRHWIKETSSTSLFALAQMLLDTKCSKAAKFLANGQATDEALAAIAQTYQRLDFPDLHWPPHPTRIYGGPDLVIETEAESWIWISGRSAAFFESAVSLITGSGVDWEQVLRP